ncbi:MAG: flavodoxin [Treponema sp.]|nr:flavodoxin [Treponema sp.]
MKVAIRYFTRTGNTEKLAKAISEALNVAAETVSRPLEEKADILFLGSSVYAAGVDDEIKEFLRNNKDKIGTLVNFSTAALLPSTYNQVKKLAEALSIEVSDKEFHCRGSFAMLHKDRPNSADIEAAAAFAKSVVS